MSGYVSVSNMLTQILRNNSFSRFWCFGCQPGSHGIVTLWRNLSSYLKKEKKRKENDRKDCNQLFVPRCLAQTVISSWLTCVRIAWCKEKHCKIETTVQSFVFVFPPPKCLALLQRLILYNLSTETLMFFCVYSKNTQTLTEDKQ